MSALGASYAASVCSGLWTVVKNGEVDQPQTLLHPSAGIPTRQVRAVFDDRSIVVYQAYGREIAEAALAHGRFVSPFKRDRMTWIKPSFLWMMYRSGWLPSRARSGYSG